MLMCDQLGFFDDFKVLASSNSWVPFKNQEKLKNKLKKVKKEMSKNPEIDENS